MRKFRIYCILSVLFMIPVLSHGQVKLETPGVESVLYLGKGRKQPLIVGLGGSEGGNAWTSDYWKKTRDQFIERGYAFLAVGYFGAKGTPAILDRIAIENVYHAIEVASGNRLVDRRRVAIIGGSRGADMALLLGSFYSDIDCVVSIVGSSAVFPGHTNHFTSSCWTYKNADLPFVPVNAEAMPFLMRRDLRGAFEAMLRDSISVQKAAIPVERIKGPVLFLSATKDEVCPSTPMADMMMARLEANHFRFVHEHKAIEGGHAAPLKHFDAVFRFLDMHFKKR